MYTLITAANSSEAYALKKLIGSEHILLGDYLDVPEVLIKTGKIILLPHPESTSYSHQMLTLCLDKNIDKIYPLRQQEREILLNSKQLFGEYGINILLNDKIQ
jgi:hypothetical protein